MSDVAALRVGRLPYLNAQPFHAGWEGPEPAWVTAPPRALGTLARGGRLDAALLASRDALALGDRFRGLGGLGVACLGPVASVLLLAHRPPAQLHGARIALSGESRTSRGLLRILVRERLGLRDVVFGEGGEERADACLAIGDAALRARREGGWSHVLDLGAAWTAWTGLPFVYAVWVVRRDVPGPVAAALAERLGAALDRRRPPAQEAAAAGLTPDAGLAYLARFVYRLGPAEGQGLRRFSEELLRHDLSRRAA